MSLPDFNKSDLAKFIKFGLTGVLNTGVDFGVFTLLSYFGIGVYTAQIISYSTGVANSYAINRSWTFATKQKFFGPQLLKFVVTNIFLLAMSIFIIFIFNGKLGLHKMLAKLIATGATVVFGFIINRLWIFS